MNMNRTLTWCSAEWPELTRDVWYAIAALRLDVFVVEQDCPYQDFDGKDQLSRHVWAVDESQQVLAYARIVAPGVSYAEPSIGRVVTALAARRSGLGKELMNYALGEVARCYGKSPVRISAQSYLIKFYTEFGFRSVGVEYLEDGIPHTEMLYTP